MAAYAGLDVYISMLFLGCHGLVLTYISDTWNGPGDAAVFATMSMRRRRSKTLLWSAMIQFIGPSSLCGVVRWTSL
jgi:hypothetical protein